MDAYTANESQRPAEDVDPGLVEDWLTYKGKKGKRAVKASRSFKRRKTAQRIITESSPQPPEIAETQSSPQAAETIEAFTSVRISPLPSSIDRDEYASLELPLSQLLSQEDSGPSTHPTSSKDLDEDSAIDLTVPSDESRPHTARSAQDSELSRIAPDEIDDSTASRRHFSSVLQNQEDPIEEDSDSTPSRAENSIFYPDTAGPAARQELHSDREVDFQTQFPGSFIETTLPDTPLPSSSCQTDTSRSRRQRISPSSAQFLTQVPLSHDSSGHPFTTVSDTTGSLEKDLDDLESHPALSNRSTKLRRLGESPFSKLGTASGSRQVSNIPVEKMASSSARHETPGASRSGRVNESPSRLHEKLKTIRRSTSLAMDSSAAASPGKDESITSPLARPPVNISTGTAPMMGAGSDYTATSVETPAQAEIFPTTEISNLMQSTQTVELFTPSLHSPPAGHIPPPLSIPTILESGRASQPPIIPFDRPILGPSELVVTLPAEGHMRHRYREWFPESTLRSIGRFIRKCDGGALPRQDRSPITEAMKSFMAQLNLATIHPDFNTDPLKFSSLAHNPQDPLSEAKWADMASTKFAFLGDLLVELGHYSPTPPLSIMARSGQPIETLDTYLRGKNVSFHRPRANGEISTFSAVNARMSLLLIASDDEGSHRTALEMEQRPVMIIDFDGSVGADDPILRFLGGTVGAGINAPLVHLIVSNSPEHIDKCLPRDMAPLERLKNLIIMSTHLKRALGRLPIDYGLTDSQILSQPDTVSTRVFDGQTLASAKMVVDFLVSNNFRGNWRLPPLPYLDLGGIDTTITFLEASAGPSTAPSRTGTPTTLKRNRDQTGTPISTKRMRATPLQEVTHISDSVKDPQSQLEDLRSALRTIEELLRSERATHATEAATLQTSLNETQAQLISMTASLSSLQQRYEKQRLQLRAYTKENSSLKANEAAIETKRERFATENVSLRDQRATLQTELAAARAQLAAGEAGPLSADLEDARAKVASLERERDSAVKANDISKRDFEFTRQQYQNASTAAAEHAATISELEAKIVLLEKDASEERRRIKEMNIKEEVRQERARVERLEGELRMKDKVLQRKEEELAAARNGRRGVQTRASSVQPGSPRLAGRGGGAESRGTSPLPGGLGEGSTVVHGRFVNVGGGRTSMLRREG